MRCAGSLSAQKVCVTLSASVTPSQNLLRYLSLLHQSSEGGQIDPEDAPRRHLESPCFGAFEHGRCVCTRLHEEEPDAQSPALVDETHPQLWRDNQIDGVDAALDLGERARTAPIPRVDGFDDAPRLLESAEDGGGRLGIVAHIAYDRPPTLCEHERRWRLRMLLYET